MNLIKIYLDFGDGLELTNPSYSGTLSNENEINPFIYRKKVGLSCVFYGIDYDKLNIKVTSRVPYLPFKIEIYNKSSGSYVEFASGECIIRKTHDFDRKLITVDSWTVIDKYTDILNVLNNKSKFSDIFDASLSVEQNFDTTPRELHNIAEYTSYSNVDDYKYYYNPDGSENIVGVTSIDWSYFNYISTEVVGGFYLHHFIAYEYDFFAPSSTEIIFNGIKKFVNRNGLAIYYNIKLTNDKSLSMLVIDVIDRLLEINGFSNYAVDDEAFVEKLLLTDIASYIDNSEFSDISLNLSDVFNMIFNISQRYWYISEYAGNPYVEFGNVMSLSTGDVLFDSDTLFIRQLSKDKSIIDYSDEQLPRTERFISENSFYTDFNNKFITYGFPSLDEVEYSVKATTDLLNVINQNAGFEQKSLLLTHVSDNVNYKIEVDLSLIDDTTAVYNYALSVPYLIENVWNNGRPFNSGVAYSQNLTFNDTIGGILATQQLETFFTDYILSDFFNKFVQTKIGQGYVKSAKLDVLSGKISWELIYYNL